MRVIYPITVTADVLTSSSIPDDTTYPAFAIGATYSQGARVIVDGKAVYECLISGTVGALPLSDALWLPVRPTPKWAMFDQLPSTGYTGVTTLTMTLQVPAISDVMLIGCEAGTVTVTLPDVTRTVTLTGNQARSVYITELSSAGGEMTLTMTTNSLGFVRIAEILIGTVLVLGETQYGAGVGIVDYSKRTTDEFGNTSFVRRGYSGTLQAQFTLDRTDTDRVLDIITALRAVPCVWIGSTHYGCTVIYGYYKECSLDVRETHSMCSIRIESLANDMLTGTVSGASGGVNGWWGGWGGWTDGNTGVWTSTFPAGYTADNPIDAIEAAHAARASSTFIPLACDHSTLTYLYGGTSATMQCEFRTDVPPNGYIDFHQYAASIL